jgi:glycosyltransferase involved in cell wall biosynthesis
MHVGLDGTPLLGQRTGIGRYTEHLLDALLTLDEATISATAFTLRGAGELPGAVPAGVRTRSLPIPARLLRAAWTRLELPPVGLISGKVDVFHGTNFVLPPTGRAGGVVTIHDLAYLTMPDVVDDNSRQLRDLVPRSLKRAAAVCTPSRATADAVLDTYGTAVPEVVVTLLGVQAEWLQIQPPDQQQREQLRLPADYFLFVGTREPRKDLSTLLQAYALFRADGGHRATDLPSLLLVGPQGWGPGHQPAPGVVIRDYTPVEQLRLIVAGARGLVMPSRDEGFGLPALEGLAAGTAVIVSDVPALVEVTGGHAAVFQIGDVAALAALLTEAAKEPITGPEAMQGRKRRREFAAAWTWQRCAEQTMAAYRIALP